MSFPPPPTDPESLRALLAELRMAAENAVTEGQVRELTARIASVTRTYRIRHRIGLPPDPLSQAREIDPHYRTRPHLAYLSQRVAQAVRDVEAGRNRMLAVSMPPRAGKSMLLSLYAPLWILRSHPDWKIVTASHDPTLTGAWARQVRRLIEDNPGLGIALASDSGGGADWRTEEGGGVYATSVRGSLTGRGAVCLIVDDPVRDFVDAHSAVMQANLWDWWLSVAQTRLEPPFLVVTVMTRWAESDLIARLLSREWEGDPDDWEQISLPALAEAGDPLGRGEGEPLLSPLLNETPKQAVARWEGVRRAVGSYVFGAMYQQHPSPAKGAIFDTSWWRFWTSNESRETSDGRVRYLDPGSLTGGRWLDSWDAAFGETTAASASYVVGQRWVRAGADRFLVGQQRGRWSFTQTLERMRAWQHGGPHPHLVHQRLIEKKANGAAIIDVLRREIPGMKPINPTASKEARARAVTPEVESGNVYLPHPADPGNEWVADLLSELREFPSGSADDQCLAAGTSIETSMGPLPIEDVRAGMRVCGASGWVDVHAAGMTSPAAAVVTRAGLTGTAGHPVWTRRGWAPLSEVTCNDVLWIRVPSQIATGRWQPVRGASSTTSAGGTSRSLDQPNHHPPELESRDSASIVGLSDQGVTRGAWAAFGSSNGARLRLRKSSGTGSDSVDTLSRATRRIAATFGPASATPRRVSTPFTGKYTSGKSAPSRTGGTFTTATAISATTSPGTSLRSRLGSIWQSRSTGGRDAAGHGMTVTRRRRTLRASGAWLLNGTVRTRVEHGTVSTPSADGRSAVPVFNLATSDGTYFANGVLVHNCDALSQALLELRESGPGLVSVPGRLRSATPPRGSLGQLRRQG